MAENIVLIKEFVNPDNFNMGLEKEGLSKFEGSLTMMDIPMINGNYVIDIPSKEHKKKILDWLGIDDFNSEQGKKVLDEFSITVNSGITSLDLNDPADLFNYYILKSKQHGIAAPDMDSAQHPLRNYKFYVADQQQETSLKVSNKEMILTAQASLLNMKKKEPKRLIYMAKYIIPNSFGVKDADSAFLSLSEYVDGKIIPPSEKPHVKFLEYDEMSNDELFAKVDIKSAIRLGIIRKIKSGDYINHLSGNALGRTEDEIYAFLIQPQNQEELGTGTQVDSVTSIRYQLNNRK